MFASLTCGHLNLKKNQFPMIPTFENRKWGILFGDKTDYDEQVVNFVTDYIELAKQIRRTLRRTV